MQCLINVNSFLNQQHSVNLYILDIHIIDIQYILNQVKHLQSVYTKYPRLSIHIPGIQNSLD
jgi:hypothetical protein